MQFRLFVSSVLAGSLVLLGCSKNDPGTATPTDATASTDTTATEGGEGGEGEGMHGHGGGHGEGQGKHAHDFSPPVDDFHTVLRPLWHAEAGEARTNDTCAAAGDLIAKAEAIVAADAPEKASDGDAWKSKGEALVGAAKALDETCKGDRAGFDASFQGVHDAFHELIALTGHGKPS